MRTFTFKSLFLTVLFVLLGSLAIQAADDGLITKQITLKLDEAGTLPNKIAVSRKNLITNLKIVGKINGTDLKFIREMAGCDFNLKKTDGKLSILDLSEAKIVAGGDAYVSYNGYRYTYNDNLGNNVFYGCSGLTSLTIPSSVTSIGDEAFVGCSGLTSLTIPSSVTWIRDYAFAGCSGLTSLTIPSGVTSIGKSAFEGCSGLTSLTLPSSVTSIGDFAFRDCSGLTSIYAYLEKIPKLGSDVFTGCDAKNCILYVPTGTLDDYLVSDFGYFENIVGINKDGLLTTQVTIKLDEAGTLPDRIGENQKNLITNLKIVGKINGTDLKFIREMAGSDFNREKTDGKLSILDLSEAKIVKGGTAYISFNGFCHHTYNDELGHYAFAGCSGLTSLTLPSGVTSIGYEAFRGCSGLTSLTLPSGVTEIRELAFAGCSGLTSLTIPSGVTSIGKWAFYGCSGLTSIYVYPENLPELGTGIFNGCDAKNCTVYVPKGTYDAYKSSEFGYFEKIVEFDASGIDKVTTSTNAKEVSRYSANGQRLSAPAKGLNIVKYSDGSVKKVVVQ